MLWYGTTLGRLETMNRRAGSILGVVLVSALTAAGCQDYVFEPVQPAIIAVSNTTQEVPDRRKADILFVIDDSGSMAGEQDNLAANFGAFINRIEEKNANRRANGDAEVKYRIAVTSTSVDLTYETSSGPTTQDFYTVQSNCQSGGYQIQNGQPYPQGDFLAVPGNQAILDSETMSSDEIIREFQENVKLGVCGSGQEQGLRAARMALEKHPDFVRAGSKLFIAIVSDEEDCSDPNHDVVLTGSGPDVCAQEAAQPNGGKLGPVSDYVDFFKSLADSVAVGVIVSAEGTPPNDMHPALCSDPTCAATCDCGGDPACEADPAKREYPCYCGGQAAGSRYLQLASAISGSLEDSICQSDFSATLEHMADIIIPDRIQLDARPHDDAPSLVLPETTRPDGSQIVCNSPQAGQTCDEGIDWAYDPTGPSIVLCNDPNSACRIQPGDKYKVSFIEQACTADNPCQ